MTMSLMPGVLEARHARHARLDMGHQPLQVAREQVLFERLGHTVDEAGGRMLLIRPEDPAHTLLAEVILRVALPQDRQLLGAGLPVVLQHRVDIGDDILMLHRDRRDL